MVWENRGGYKIPPSADDAAAYMEEVAFWDVTESTKGKHQEGLLRYSKWLQLLEVHFDGLGESGYRLTARRSG